MALARSSPRKQDRAGQIFGSRRGRRYHRIAHERTRAETGIADVAGRQHAAVLCVETYSSYSHAIVGHLVTGGRRKVLRRTSSRTLLCMPSADGLCGICAGGVAMQNLTDDCDTISG
jgi:hypothetical protein